MLASLLWSLRIPLSYFRVVHLLGELRFTKLADRILAAAMDVITWPSHLTHRDRDHQMCVIAPGCLKHRVCIGSGRYSMPSWRYSAIVRVRCELLSQLSSHISSAYCAGFDDKAISSDISHSKVDQVVRYRSKVAVARLPHVNI